MAMLRILSMGQILEIEEREYGGGKAVRQPGHNSVEWMMSSSDPRDISTRDSLRAYVDLLFGANNRHDLFTKLQLVSEKHDLSRVRFDHEAVDFVTLMDLNEFVPEGSRL